MAVKTDRIEARLSPDERRLIDRAAAMSGLSSSAFLVSAAVDRAEKVLAASTVTAIASDYFDHLLAALDEVDALPRLSRAVAHSRRRPRIRTV